MNQTSIFDIIYQPYKITKKIKIIELFSGYGSQALALKRLGVPFDHHKTCEWAIKSIQAYKDIHMTNDNTDYSKDLSVEELKEYLYQKGISSNYNEPMTKEQINRLNEDNLRTIYNNIQATHNLVNIQQVKGKDLEINKKDKYDYIMTYSFPCQDLSLAGKGKGMSDTTTRSGMLWEVERILTECQELNQLPQILLMENVPQVHGVDNVADFNKWKSKLEEMGYKNYFEDLIATDYGIPQTRNRCFMISLLGDYSYSFPPKQKLKTKLKDLLEDNVAEKYYLSDKMIDYIYNDKTGNYGRKEARESIDKNIEKGIACTITTNAGSRATDNFIKVKNATKKGYLEAHDGDGIDISSRMEHHRGTVQKGKTQTLTTMGGENNGVVVGTYQYAKSDKFMHGKERLQLGKETSDTLQTTPKEGKATVTNDMYTESERQLFTEDGNIKRYMNSDIVDEFKEGQMATTTYPNGYGHGPRTHDNSVALNTIDKPSVKQNLRIRKLTPKECFRLMGVSDEDFEKCAKNQSDSSLYHLAGDSIVVDVICAIIKQLL